MQRLEQIFKQLDESLKGKTCEGMNGLLKEGDEQAASGSARLFFDRCKPSA